MYRGVRRRNLSGPERPRVVNESECRVGSLPGEKTFYLKWDLRRARTINLVVRSELDCVSTLNVIEGFHRRGSIMETLSLYSGGS